MSETDNTQRQLPDPYELAEAVKNVAAESQAVLVEFMKAQGIDTDKDLDPIGLYPAFFELTKSLMNDPRRLMEVQFNAWKGYMQIWHDTAQRMMGADTEPVIKPEPGDRRFNDDDWRDNPFFDYIKQCYLLAANATQRLVTDLDDIDDKTAHKIEFFTKQYVDAVSPSNFALTNPEVMRATVESGGKNLLDGLRNFLADIDPETGSLKTQMVDSEAFELGRNVATTPGKVICQTDLMQLIQYQPTTESVFRTPLLIVPPWINKYYILDLQEKNSFIRWALDQGHTVFVMSWVNPDASLREKDFEDYVMEGTLAAIDAVKAATGEDGLNLIGYCLGGTLVGATLGYLQARGDNCVLSTTFFVSLLDFSEPGDLGVFIDESQVQNLERMMDAQGYLDGAEMATTFNMLRANDLIWSFVVNNYLLGREPMAFDLLYWNADSTRLPAKMHSTYLRKMYLENAFREPGGITIAGTPIDIGSVDIPVYFISTADDHIAPWKTTYLGAQALGGEKTFVLAKSGHIAGIINPPSSGRQYGHFTGPSIEGITADEWFDRSEEQEGSWWPGWQTWIERFTGERVPARVPGDTGLTVIEDAPGSYACARLD